MTTRDGTSTVLLYPSGVFFDPIHPEPAKIHIEDIAHHLSVIPRFGGGTERPYMVAQHAVLVSQVIEQRGGLSFPLDSPNERARRVKECALWGLLHEVAEACSGFGDVLAPVKRLPAIAAVIKPIEHAIEAAAAKAWGLPEDFASVGTVKWADRYLLDWEDRDLRSEGLPPHLGYAEPDPGRRSREELEHGPPLPEEKIVAWPWEEARARFLRRFLELGGQWTDGPSMSPMSWSKWRWAAMSAGPIVAEEVAVRCIPRFLPVYRAPIGASCCSCLKPLQTGLPAALDVINDPMRGEHGYYRHTDCAEPDVRHEAASWEHAHQGGGSFGRAPVRCVLDEFGMRSRPSGPCERSTG